MDTVERRIPKRWTDAEDNVLYREARSQLANGQVKDWNRIAAKLPGRTNKDCRKRWINKVCGSLKKGVWDEDEDERLREAVRVHGQNAADDEFLVTLVQAHGRDWKLLHEQEFPTRSRNELKNRYSTLMRKPSTANGGESRSSCSAPSPVSRILDETPQQPAEGETGPVLAEAGAENSTYQNNPDTQMQWEDTKADGMLIDTWVDSLGADWMQHMGTPFSGSPASAILSSSDGSSSSGSTMAVDKTGAQQPETLAPTAVMKSSKDINDAMHNSSPLQWPSGASDAAAQSTFFPLDHTGTSEWTPADSTLVMETHLQQSPMVLTSGRQDSIHEALGAERLLARSNSALKRISLTVDQCDANTLEDLLSCVKKLKGKVKLEIDV
ncbi:hypothetical protein S40285_10551 [Stachybotrys chlorohalonatus IBT 40285]|uniref:Myb-like domain-containing protein n=1 Tax=Stachybotrys chlorohalonatus (strain IBT 40285) TaxID=1283841 RepID=A0A084Q9B4_STAC4|nr:hypothetical protein S40285_10551 [Stachybotrys chlorohalonata IBT 40285]